MPKNSASTKAQERHSTDITFRKEMGRIALDRLSGTTVSQISLADKLGVTQGTISKWGLVGDQSCPNFIDLIKMCDVIGVSIYDLLEEATESIEKKKVTDITAETLTSIKQYLAIFGFPYGIDDSYDPSPEHMKRLAYYSEKEYVGIYLPLGSETEAKPLNMLHITTELVDERGFCPFSMYINDKYDHPYVGKIVSSHPSHYSYFYLAGGAMAERGMWILYHPPFLQDEFLCGSGVLLSIDRDVSTPSFQRIVMIKKEHYNSGLNVQIESFLREKTGLDRLPVIVYPTESDYRKAHDKVYSIVFPSHEQAK